MTERSKNKSYYRLRTAVLGASGFIGRWVARSLCDQGAEVYLIVRDKDAAKKVFSRYGVYGEILEADLIHPAGIKSLFQRIRPSITFNLAGYGIDRMERNEKTAYQINASLLEVLCEAIRDKKDSEWGGQEIIHVGSALEYGSIAGNLSEESVPNPTTLYGRSKLAGTNLLARCCNAYGIRGLTARLFTVYGPGEHEGRLLPSLLDIAKTGKALGLTAGYQKRDFTYVEDVAEGLLLLGKVKSDPGYIVNLATGRLTSVRDFVLTAAKILQIPSDRLNFGAIPVREEEMVHSEVSLLRLKQLTGWLPSMQIGEGIRNTYHFENE